MRASFSGSGDDPEPAVFQPAEASLPAEVIPEDSDLQAYVRILERVNRGLRSFINEMTIVFRFIETVSRVHSLQRIADLLLEVLKELCAYDAAALYLAEDSGGGELFVLKAADNLRLVEQLQKELEIDERIYHWVDRQGHAVIIPNQFRGKSSSPGSESSFMIAPLLQEDGGLGRIEMVFKRPQGAFTQQTFSILDVLLKHAVVIIANERLYEKERKTVQKYIELDMLKKDVVNVTTHEIKTPLTIIQAASMLLQHQRVPAAERKLLLQKIIRQCEKINLIVSELFETSQLDEQQSAVRPETFSLRKLTEEICESLEDPATRARITLESEPVEKSNAWADRQGIAKAVRNLVENAVKYSPEGGTINIAIQVKHHKLVWSIRDRGLGISPDDQSRIFDKFFRGGASTTRRVGGLGLGLYIVKSCVEMNHGSIRVQSRLGEGTTFIMELPAQPLEETSA